MFKTTKHLILLIIIIPIFFAGIIHAADKKYNISESNNFPKCLSYIKRYYVEPERIDMKEMFKSSLNELQKNVPEILVQFSSPTSAAITIDNATKKFSSSMRSYSDFWKMMKEILMFIELNYKGEVKLDDIEAIIINGALNDLDPHSAFLTPAYYKEFKIDTGGEFGGLGIVITSKDGQLTVIAPIEDTPAWRAGVRSKDIILQIDNESTVNMSLMKAVERLRGKVGTKVRITVERKGKAAPFDITLTRANIHIESVKSALIKEDEGNVAYIKLKRFQRDTAKNFFKELKKLQTQSGTKFKGLILDLRNNPGGLLNEAVDIADTFLSSGVIVSTVGANKTFIDEDKAHMLGTESADYPIVVLVNEGSASASEIVAGTLQAHNRALVIGQRTFGKGSVQSVYDLGDNYALKLTIAQYLTAGKHSIQTVGVTPDIVTIPETVDKELIDIFPNKPPSEKELEKHLSQISPTDLKAKVVIGYYKPYMDDEKAAEELRKKEYSGKLDFTDDFLVKLSTKIILASKSSNADQILNEAKPIIHKLEKQEEEKISSKLQELGTLWSAGENKAVNLKTTSSVEQNKKIVSKAFTGEDLELILNLTNGGKSSIHKIIGVIDSDNPFLDEKELVFGKILPNQTVKRKVKIKLPLSMSSRNIPYKVNFKQGDTPLNHYYSSTLKVEEPKRPIFAINYQLEKPLTVGPKHPLPRGKSVPISVRIKNIGTGATKDARAYFSNKDNEKGIFIEEGRNEIGIIKPGQTKKVTFAFKVQPNIKTSTFVLQLTITDREFLEFIVVDLNVTIESGTIYPQPGIWYEGPQVNLYDKKMPIISKSSKYQLKGELTDDSSIKDYYIFVNNEKVKYESNPHESNKLDFNFTLHLEKPNNEITIIARDNNNLITRKSFVIQKGIFQ